MRKDAPLYPLRPFALFVLLFPHLIAGPIVRHNELVPQFDLDPRAKACGRASVSACSSSPSALPRRCSWPIAFGSCRSPVRPGRAPRARFRRSLDRDARVHVSAVLRFFRLHRNGDRIALLFGLLLPENFRRPYVSTSVRDFWRRWHISLSNFIRDYLYIPSAAIATGSHAMSSPPWRPWASAGCGTAPAGPMWCGACGTASAFWCAMPGRA